MLSTIIAFLLAHWMELLLALQGLLMALLALFMIIPGDAPDKQLKAVVEFISKFSVKK